MSYTVFDTVFRMTLDKGMIVGGGFAVEYLNGCSLFTTCIFTLVHSDGVCWTGLLSGGGF